YPDPAPGPTPLDRPKVSRHQPPCKFKVDGTLATYERGSTVAHTDELYLGKKEYQVLGRRPIRHDGADKVTGKAIYTADVQLPNMAHGTIVRSPHAHARIRSIDASEAMKIPGVFAV